MTLAWRKVDANHLRSEPDGFTITRATVHGAYTYSAVRLGKRWKGVAEGFDVSTVLVIERGIPIADEDARRAAVRRLQAVCEAAT